MDEDGKLEQLVDFDDYRETRKPKQKKKEMKQQREIVYLRELPKKTPLVKVNYDRRLKE